MVPKEHMPLVRSFGGNADEIAAWVTCNWEQKSRNSVLKRFQCICQVECAFCRIDSKKAFDGPAFLAVRGTGTHPELGRIGLATVVLKEELSIDTGYLPAVGLFELIQFSVGQ